MGEKESRLLPDPGDEFIEVVGRRRTVKRPDALFVRGARQQAVLGAVDQLGLLALFHRLDRQPQLLRGLVVGAAVQVGDAPVHAICAVVFVALAS
jgi:hypothetical protein